MPVSLTKIERAVPPAGDGRAAVTALQERLARLNLAQAVHGHRLIILLEGWRGSGKKAVLRLLAGALDPCRTVVHCGDTAEFADDGRHWLAPYWARLPKTGHSAVFYHGWYGEAVRRHLADDKASARLTDEINEFEAQQTDHGTVMIKLFLHVSEEAQSQRLAERRRDPWLASLEQQADVIGATHTQASAAWDSVFAVTDTRWAPWRLIDGEDSVRAQLAALAAVTTALERVVPAEPRAVDPSPAIPLSRDPVFG